MRLLNIVLTLMVMNATSLQSNCRLQNASILSNDFDVTNNVVSQQKEKAEVGFDEAHALMFCILKYGNEVSFRDGIIYCGERYDYIVSGLEGVPLLYGNNKKSRGLLILHYF